jgi:DNA-binding CsgD family transcriptional regulator
VILSCQPSGVALGFRPRLLVKSVGRAYQQADAIGRQCDGEANRARLRGIRRGGERHDRMGVVHEQRLGLRRPLPRQAGHLERTVGGLTVSHPALERLTLLVRRAADLHDTLLHTMTGIGYKLQICRASLGESAPRGIAQVESADATRLERTGARGFLTKGADANQIAEAIRQAHAGEQSVRRGYFRGAAFRAEDAVSPREKDVLALLRQGATNAQIAQRLAITEAKVKSHMASLMEKLHAPDRAGVVARAFDLGILRPGTVQ